MRRQVGLLQGFEKMESYFQIEIMLEKKKQPLGISLKSATYPYDVNTILFANTIKTDDVA